MFTMGGLWVVGVGGQRDMSQLVSQGGDREREYGGNRNTYIYGSYLLHSTLG